MKYISLTVLVLLVLVGVYLGIRHFDQKGDSKALPLTHERAFAYPNFDDIDKIWIRERNKEGYFINRSDNNKWYAYDDVLVNDVTISGLKKVLTNLEILNIPTGKMAKTQMRRFNQLGIEVRLYDKKNRMLRHYWVGADMPGEGTVFHVDGHDKPYVMTLPFFVGGVRTYYLNKPVDIQDRTLVSIPSEEIKSIKIDYPKEKSKSFELLVDQQIVNSLYPRAEKETRIVRSNRVDDYLIEYKKLACEGLEPDNPYHDKIAASVPLASVSIKKKNGEEKLFKLYWLEDFIDENVSEKEQQQYTLVKRMFYLDDNDVLAVVQHRLCKEILVGYDFFY